MSLKKILAGLEIDKRSGYSVVDVVRLLKAIYQKPAGRPSLVKRLGLGEASLKTLIKNLRRQGFTEHSARGEMLTEMGREICSRLNNKIPDTFGIRIPAISKRPSVAVVVRNASKRVKMGIEQRDEAMKLGVSVTTLIFQEGKIKFPRTGEVFRFAGNIEERLKEDDVLIIASGENEKKAERGGIAAALTLI